MLSVIEHVFSVSKLVKRKKLENVKNSVLTIRFFPFGILLMKKMTSNKSRIDGAAEKSEIIGKKSRNINYICAQTCFIYSSS